MNREEARKIVTAWKEGREAEWENGHVRIHTDGKTFWVGKIATGFTIGKEDDGIGVKKVAFTLKDNWSGLAAIEADYWIAAPPLRAWWRDERKARRWALIMALHIGIGHTIGVMDGVVHDTIVERGTMMMITEMEDEHKREC